MALLRGGWCTEKVGGNYGVSLWGYISEGWSDFSKGIAYDVGTGHNISFWLDRWWGDGPGMFNVAGLDGT